MDGMIGEVRIHAGSFVPEGWRPCNGALVANPTEPRLFDVLGTRWGAVFAQGYDLFGLPTLPDPAPGLKYIICARGISKVMEGTYGEITIYAGTTDPKFAMACDGRTLSINDNDNQVLYAVLGNKFGGDFSRNTFRLPTMTDPTPGLRHVMCVKGWFPFRE